MCCGYFFRVTEENLDPTLMKLNSDLHVLDRLQE